MHLPALVLAMTPADAADFLPAETTRRLLSMPFALRELPIDLAAPMGPAAWGEALTAQSPEVLLSCWSTPPLPADLPLAADGTGSLRYVCHLAGTVRRLVPRVLLERGLRVSNWGGSISRTVAEHALLLILSSLRRHARWSVAMHREGAWKTRESVTESLFGRRVGIHGFGLIAQQLVGLLRPFGGPVSAYAPGVAPARFEELGVSVCDNAKALYAGSDVVVCLAPGTSANFHVVDEPLLRSIPAGGVFVNISRGVNVDEAALLRVAREGQLQIALDVYEHEPLDPASPLRGLPNVTLSPHLGGPTKDRRRDAGEFGLCNLARYARGLALEAELSPAIYDLSS